MNKLLLAMATLVLLAQPVRAACTAPCINLVDFLGENHIAAGKNPLYDISMQSIALEDVKRLQLESFRKLLEVMRRSAEKDRKATLADLRHHKINAATASANAKRYEDAVVNYYLGLNAYREQIAATPKK